MEKAQETPTLIRQRQRNQATFFLQRQRSLFLSTSTITAVHHPPLCIIPCHRDPPSSSLSSIRSLIRHRCRGKDSQAFTCQPTSTLARYFYWSNRTNIQSDSNHRTRRIQQTETQLLLRQYASTRRSPFFSSLDSCTLRSLRPSFPGQHLCPRFFYASNHVKTGVDFSLKIGNRRKKRERERKWYPPPTR